MVKIEVEVKDSEDNTCTITVKRPKTLKNSTDTEMKTANVIKNSIDKAMKELSINK